jgi:hypothetical protein
LQDAPLAFQRIQAHHQNDHGFEVEVEPHGLQLGGI